MKPGYLFKIINVFAAFTFFCLAAQAANIEWSVPAPADDDTNVITAGSLDRAYVLGYGSERVSVNGVNFVRFGKNRAQNQNQESVTDGQTQLIVGGDGDGIIADKTQIKESFESSASYHSLLDAGVHDNGSPLALILEDLAVGKRYYLQIWLYDPSNPKSALALSGGTNSVRIDSLIACQVVGTFVADTIRQAVVITPFRGSAQLNAFQLRRADDFAGEPTLIQQPRSITTPLGGSTKLVALATGNPEPTFQWQKLDGHDVNDLTDNGMLSGSKTSTLTVHSAPLEAAGDYRFVAMNSSGAVTSSVVSITVVTNPLINVAVSGAELVSYQGRAVLPGTPYDLWNSVDSRSSFTNVALMDSTGTATPVTLSLQKAGSGSAIPEPLLGGISYATQQIVTISNLLANEFYDLAVFSIGSQANEGGVFSGSVNGMAKGYPNGNVTPANFLAGVNYVENPFAQTDNRGTLTFTINANKTVQSNGYYNCDFNGLQLRKSSWPQGKPVVLQQPSATAGYVGQSATLSVLSAVSTDDPLTYQWQKVTPSGFSNLIDADNVTGVNSHQVTFHHLSASDSGTYQVAISSSNGSVTSRIAAVKVFTNQLINVAVNPGGGPCNYNGLAVLPGLPTDRWNGVDARRSFNNHPLVDSTGKPTAVTMSLFKTAGDAIPNALLGGISYAAKHIVTLNGLEPDNFYHLVVFSIGDQANEGGVFTGAVNGISHGYSIRNGAKADFIENTNYVENLFARTDDKGQLRFTIRPNATIMPYGYDNCDFNGLQLQQTSLAHHAPVFPEPLTSVRTYLHHPTTLRATVAGPTDSVMACQWQKITPRGAIDCHDGKLLSGSESSVLSFPDISTRDAGKYQLIAKNNYGSITSSIVTLTVETNQLINVAVNPGAGRNSYQGLAVLPGTTNDVWTAMDARTSITNVPLFDSNGSITPVRLTLIKSGDDSSALPHPLLGGISYASSQVVVLKNLLPNEFYDLVVYSVGGQPNEGGVFSGDVKGVARGYAKAGVNPPGFAKDINYVENPWAQSDSDGTLTFTIRPNATVLLNGYRNCDFNGLQLRER